MLTLAIALLIGGAGVCALASLIDTTSRVPGLLRQLEADRKRHERTTTYTGPVFNRHGREIERN